MTPAELTKLAIAALEDMKGINIELIDVAPLTSIADHMVICTGTSNRHVKALADSVMKKASEAGVGWPRSQGLETGDWALVDLNGTIVHIMLASARATYQLEKLWDLGQPKPKLDAVKKAKKLAKKMAKKAGKKSAPKPAANKKPGGKKVAAKALPKKKAVPAKPAPKAAVKKIAAKPVVKAAAKKAVAKAPVKKVAAKKAPAKKIVVAKKPAPKAPAKSPVKAIKKSAVKKPVVKAKKR
ncbi:MAG: ribosome silencing factor [Pseudomonadota bacterium]